MHCCESWANADQFVQVPIHASGIGRTSTLVSEICWTSMLYLESYYYVTNILISCGRSIAVKVGPMLIHLCNCQSMHRELVGHPRFYQKFVGHPRYVFGIYVTNILISCGRCIAVKVGQMPIHFVQVPIHASGIGRTHTLVSEICWTSATYWQSYYYVTNILISCGRCIRCLHLKIPHNPESAFVIILAIGNW